MARNTPKEVSKKVHKKTKEMTPAQVAKELNEKTGKPLDISKTSAPLRESGSTLPPLVKGK